MRVLGAELLAVLAFGALSSCSLNTTGEGPEDGGADQGDVDGPGPDLPDVEADEAEDGGELDDGRPPDDGAREDGDGADVRFCGNGAADDGEACDGTDLRDATCESLGRLPGVLGCTTDCMLDLSGCPPPLTCGNGLAEPGEICDGDDLRGSDCLALGYVDGTLACATGCTLDTSGCVPGCADACVAPGVRGCGGTRIRICVVGPSGCLEWRDEVDCAATGQVCYTATGVPACLGGSGESCADPLVLGTLPYNDSGGDITAEFANDQDFLGTHCDTASGVEAVFVRFLSAGESIRIRETGNMDAVLRVLSTCSDAAECLASRGDPEDPGLTFTAPADGNYYFVVEAYHAIPASKGFNFTIEVSPGGDLCTDPLVADPLPYNIHAGDFRTRFTDDVRFSSSTCQSADGREAFLARTMRAGETVRLRETGTLDAVLHVRDSCDPTAPCLLSRDAPETPGVTFTAPVDGTYFFVVEARLALPSTVGYDITLEEAPDGNICTDPIRAVDLPATSSGGDIRTAFTDDVRFTGTGCSPAAGPELFFSRTMAAGETVRLSDDGTLDVVLRVLGSCDPAAPCLADRGQPEMPGLTFTAPADGTYAFVAEAVLATPGTTGYAVTLDDPPPGNLCTDPYVVTVPVTVSGRDFTAEWTNDLDFIGRNCSAAGGAELVLAVDATAGETIQIDERGGLDVVIRVLTACDRLAECLYSVDSPENPGVNFVAPADGRYDIVIEGLLAFPGVRDYEIVLSHP